MDDLNKGTQNNDSVQDECWTQIFETIEDMGYHSKLEDIINSLKQNYIVNPRNNNSELNTYTTITKIQLMTKTPYKVIAIYPFLYTPSDVSKLVIGDHEHRLSEIEDSIDSNGNIIRYVRFI